MRRSFAGCWLGALFVLWFPTRLLSQAGSLDASFHPALNAGADVYAVALQTNGQILIGGAFSSVEDQPRANVARVNPDGTLDATFDPGAAADLGYINAIAVQNDGKILVAGFFYSSFGLDSGMLTRLNPDGTLDSTFDPSLYIDAPVNAVLVQPDGKILFGGSFQDVNFLTRRSVARIEADGTLDYSFDACIAASDGSGATALALQNDNRILASGNFNFSTGYSRNGIARLGECGELDPTYAPEPGVDSTNAIYTIAFHADGTVLIGGNFGSFHGTARRGIAQLTTEGLVDSDFDPGAGIEAGAAVYTVASQKNGKMMIAGTFHSYNKNVRFGLARINVDGSIDTGYDAGIGPNNAISSLVFQKDGALLVGGRFSSFDGVARSGIGRLNADAPTSRLGAPSRSSNGFVQFSLFGDAQSSYTLQASSNFVDWVSFMRVAGNPAGVAITDSNAPANPFRFYRAILK
jgi:uncharacterized delta-60 repeat protein